jgi:hypothetical protein
MNSDRHYPAHPQSDQYIYELGDEWLELPDPEVAQSVVVAPAARSSQHRSLRRVPEKRPTPIAQIISQIQAGMRKHEESSSAEPSNEQGYNRHFYHSKGTTTPWWIIIAAWVSLGIPMLLLSIQQLSHLTHPVPEISAAAGESIAIASRFTLPFALVSIAATFIIFYILGRQTARRIRSDRRQERLRRHAKERETVAVGSEN